TAKPLVRPDSRPTVSETPLPPPPPPPPDEKTAGAIEVLVRSKGVAVPGAMVNLQWGNRSLQAVTAQDGRCTVSRAEPGEWRIFARSAGVATAFGKTTVETGKTARVELDLGAAVRLEGTVRDEAGTPVPGAKISMSLPDPAFTVRTDAAGIYIVPDVPAGIHAITASSERFRPDTVTNFDMSTPGETYRRDFTLKFGLSVTGRVTDDTGQAVIRATVTVSNEVARVVRTDENGEFRAEGLGEGPVTVSVVARGYAPASLRDVKPGQGSVPVVLTRGALVIGRIEPVDSPFSVHTSRYDDELARWQLYRSVSFTSATGVFQVADLPAGRYEIVIETSERKTPGPVSFILEAGQKRDLGLVVLAPK
ncbi:MAG TPA: carboxypeptidase-like regulatory domain-containing protein, partial [Planctomycetota bacterium]|nr:carboxypeptidase-like regulatory domain-containing protein [Planctomycetota bacterium]